MKTSEKANMHNRPGHAQFAEGLQKHTTQLGAQFLHLFMLEKLTLLLSLEKPRDYGNIRASKKQKIIS